MGIDNSFLSRSVRFNYSLPFKYLETREHFCPMHVQHVLCSCRPALSRMGLRLRSTYFLVKNALRYDLPSREILRRAFWFCLVMCLQLISIFSTL